MRRLGGAPGRHGGAGAAHILCSGARSAALRKGKGARRAALCPCRDDGSDHAAAPPRERAASHASGWQSAGQRRQTRAGRPPANAARRGACLRARPRTTCRSRASGARAPRAGAAPPALRRVTTARRSAPRSRTCRVVRSIQGQRPERRRCRSGHSASRAMQAAEHVSPATTCPRLRR